MNAIPHISALMKPSIEETIDGAETIVIGNRSEEFLDIAAKLQDGQVLVDLVRIGQERSGGAYDGICW
jgi:GDP-mannose 6-dehydrogenase